MQPEKKTRKKPDRMKKRLRVTVDFGDRLEPARLIAEYLRKTLKKKKFSQHIRRMLVMTSENEEFRKQNLIYKYIDVQKRLGVAYQERADIKTQLDKLEVTEEKIQEIKDMINV